ncbi:MAG: cyclohydrolase [Rhodospirillaceae bacterium]|jgi:GTP cyclohydrolase II|nr:cyclohydrolase [Rhodospirillaceae bacterium]
MLKKRMPLGQVHSRTATALAAVERALAELRRGGIVVLRDDDGAGGLVIAAESCGPRALQRLQGLAQDAPVLVTTRRRAEAIGMEIPPHIAGGMGETNKPITLDLPEGVPVDVILQPHERTPPNHQGGARRHVALRSLSRPVVSHASRIAQTAIELAKLARLLPAVVLGPLSRDHGNKRRDWAREQDLIYVDAADVLAYEDTASRNLQQVAQAHVPLEGAENARILAWRPSDGGKEHLAIVVGEIDPTEPVLIRLHSECFTGDLLGSLRCDCGLQLRGAITEIAKQGSGVLLYLAQEGRGIGLVNKLRAYELQDDGFDTIDANEQLGFDADERIYAPAATILARMGIKRVRLMTNNPQKITQLERYGIEVAERVAHSFPANGHNENYLRTKAERAGHLL